MPTGKIVSAIGLPPLPFAFSEYLAPVQVAVAQPIALDRSASVRIVSVRIEPPSHALGKIVSDRFAPCRFAQDMTASVMSALDRFALTRVA